MHRLSKFSCICLLGVLLLAAPQAFAQEAATPAATVGNTPGRLLSALQLEQAPWHYDLASAMVDPTKVYKLSLQGQKLKAFPLEILMFPNLQVLNLSRNRIDSLPPEISILTNLQEINLGRNRLKKLPESIQNLQNLNTLLLSGNGLYKFPYTMRSLQNLRYLDVTLNDLLTFEVNWIQETLPNCVVKY
jgi:Leucine-rich repeat (LRR) protein